KTCDGEGAVGVLFADADSGKPTQEAEERMPRQAKLCRKLLRGPAPRAHLAGKPKLHCSIGERRGVIRLDRRAEPRLVLLVPFPGHSDPCDTIVMPAKSGHPAIVG